VSLQKWQVYDLGESRSDHVIPYLPEMGRKRNWVISQKVRRKEKMPIEQQPKKVKALYEMSVRFNCWKIIELHWSCFRTKVNCGRGTLKRLSIERRQEGVRKKWIGQIVCSSTGANQSPIVSRKKNARRKRQATKEKKNLFAKKLDLDAQALAHQLRGERCSKGGRTARQLAP